MFKRFIGYLLLGAGAAHLHLHYPPTLRGDNNPYTIGRPDNYLNYPYGCCEQPTAKSEVCKGHHKLLGTSEGQPVATWVAGKHAKFSLSGRKISATLENPIGGTHGGGSGQIGFSTDRGKTFKVVKTWQGNFPDHNLASIEPTDLTYDFVVPKDIPTGQAIFAWSWVNREQEFNMNCAVVRITDIDAEQGVPSRKTEMFRYNATTPAINRMPRSTGFPHMAFYRDPKSSEISPAFSDRPDMLLDIDTPGARCFSQGNPAELRYPDPGPDVEESPYAEYNPLVEPNCFG